MDFKGQWSVMLSNVLVAMESSYSAPSMNDDL